MEEMKPVVMGKYEFEDRDEIILEALLGNFGLSESDPGIEIKKF